MKNIDTFKHQGIRRKLINSLRDKGIKDERVLQAMMDVPRHFFIGRVPLEIAYADRAFEIEAGQTISQPYTVAFQSQLLSVDQGMKVLEIGTGSGYQAYVLEKLGAKIFSIERHKILFERTKKLLAGLGSRIKVFYGDGFKGLPAFAPFDRILITCGAPALPLGLLPQLKAGGILVAPVGSGPVQTMTTIVKKDEKHHEVAEWGDFRFVPMLQNKT